MFKNYKDGKLLKEIKHGIWKKKDNDGKERLYDYDKNEWTKSQLIFLVDYPREARANEINGIVKIKLTLDENCETTTLTAITSLGYGCEAAAIEGIKKGLEKFKQIIEDCKNFDEIISVEFKLE